MARRTRGGELDGQNLAREDIDRRMLLALADVDVRTAMALGGAEVEPLLLTRSDTGCQGCPKAGPDGGLCLGAEVVVVVEDVGRRH